MFRRRRTPRGDWYTIESGRVGCPIRGDLDIEDCFGCNHLVGVADDEDANYIVCRPSRTAIYAICYDVPIHSGF